MEMANVKAMPGSIPAPNSGSIMEKNKKNIGSQMGQTDKKTFFKAETSFKKVFQADLNLLLQYPRQFQITTRQLEERYLSSLRFLLENQSAFYIWPNRWIYQSSPPPHYRLFMYFLRTVRSIDLDKVNLVDHWLCKFSFRLELISTNAQAASENSFTSKWSKVTKK
jgi:hypothetical protein